MSDAPNPTVDKPAAKKSEPAETLDPHEVVMSPEAVAFRKEQVKEWTTWVAVQEIPYGAVVAYRVGDAVPAANVKRWKYDELGLVAKRTTKAGGEAVASVVVPVSVADIKAPGDE